jgi:hypothetical protein
MKTFSYVVIAMVLLALAPGCGDNKDKGINRPDQRKDLPRAAPSEDKKS